MGSFGIIKSRFLKLARGAHCGRFFIICCCKRMKLGIKCILLLALQHHHYNTCTVVWKWPKMSYLKINTASIFTPGCFKWVSLKRGKLPDSWILKYIFFDGKNFPAIVKGFPFRVKRFPGIVKSFPLVVKCFPAVVKSFPLMVKSFPLIVKSFPAAVKSFPAKVKSFPAIVKCFSAL